MLRHLFFVLVDRRVNLLHLFLREWQRRTQRHLRCFQVGCRILRNPLSLHCEAEERTQPFQLLDTRPWAVFPSGAKLADSREVEFNEEAKSSLLRKFLHLTIQQLVLANRRIRELAGFYVGEKFLPRGVESLRFLLGCPPLVRLPGANHLLCALPITEFEGLSQF